MFILLAFFLGGIGGAFATVYTEKIDVFLQMIADTNDFLLIPSVVLFLLMIVLGYGYSFLKYRKAKQLVEEGYDDDSYDKAEEDLSKATVVTNVLSGFNYLFFGICLFSAEMGENDLSVKQAVFGLIISIIFMIASTCALSCKTKR